MQARVEVRARLRFWLGVLDIVGFSDAGRTVARIARVASAAPGAIQVRARPVSMAVVRTEGALVDVRTVEAIAGIARCCARACVAAGSVAASSERVARMRTERTLINVRACDPVACVAVSACAAERACEVGACCLRMAIVGVGGAFIDLVARVGRRGVAAAALARAAGQMRVRRRAHAGSARGGATAGALGTRGIARGTSARGGIRGGGAGGHTRRGIAEVRLWGDAAGAVVRCAAVARGAARVARLAFVIAARVLAGDARSEARGARLVRCDGGRAREAVGRPGARALGARTVARLACGARVGVVSRGACRAARSAVLVPVASDGRRARGAIGGRAVAAGARGGARRARAAAVVLAAAAGRGARALALREDGRVRAARTAIAARGRAGGARGVTAEACAAARVLGNGALGDAGPDVEGPDVVERSAAGGACEACGAPRPAAALAR